MKLRTYLVGEHDGSLLPAEIAAQTEAAVAEYWAIRDRVFDLLRQADAIAGRIHALRAAANDGFPSAKGGAAIDPVARVGVAPAKSGTIGQLCAGLLAQGWQFEEILAEVRRQFPNARTTKACLAWYKTKMKLRSNGGH